MMKHSFDFAIVGAGSAGCVLANRLSASGARVALLEAGPADSSHFIHTPATVGFVVGQNKIINWCFDTVPQKQLNNRRLFWPRGKTLGGSSSINAMVYIRGQPEDFNQWNIPGWSWEEILPSFKSTERQLNMESVDQEFHGTEGELAVSNQRHTHAFSHLFIEAALQEGESLTKDFNGYQQEGFGLYQVTQLNGKRCSSAKAFLTPEVKRRENLTIITNAQATKLQINPQTKEVEGVYFVDNSDINQASSQYQIEQATEFIDAGEVILCGGAVNSPHLLMLSGIGPKDELESNGIEMIHELPGVGKNLQDHVDLILSCKEKGTTSYGLSKTPAGLWRNLKDLVQYTISNSGPLASNAAEAGGFIRSSSNVSRPDIQFHFVPGLILDHCRTLIYDYGYSLHSCILQPKSKGFIGLSSNHPLDNPKIDPNYLDHPEDLQTLLLGLKKARKYTRSSLFEKHIESELHPPPTSQSDEQLIAWIRQQAETVYHPVGTCKMGFADDSFAVVDPQLKVHGLKRLRVADASIMPNIISGNTNATSIAIGEKCSTFIQS